jgi:hypothetical protein
MPFVCTDVHKLSTHTLAIAEDSISFLCILGTVHWVCLNKTRISYHFFLFQLEFSVCRHQ